MDKSKVLIMIRDKNTGKLVDRTDQVMWYRFDDNAIRVKFVSSSKFYYKSYHDMFVFDKPVSVEEYEKMHFNGHRFDNIHKMLRFDSYYRVFFHNGSSLVYHQNEVGRMTDKTKEQLQWVLRFNYFKELAKLNAIESDFLDSQYNNLNIDKTTVLYKYLNQSDVQKFGHRNEYIYPFGLNLSQKQALENAFTHDVSFIEGPPGTGKTQTILNIIANAVYQNQKIAVVSNNNSAIENVKEKLKEHNLDFITALLGNKENKQVFFEDEVVKPKPLDDLVSAKSQLSVSNAITRIRAYQTRLPELYKVENQLAKTENEITNTKTEYQHFQQNVTGNADSKRYHKQLKKLRTPKDALTLLTLLSQLEHLSLLDRLKLRFKHKVKQREIHEADLADLSVNIKKKYYDLKIEALVTRKKKLEKLLAKENFEEAKETFVNLSKHLFKRYLSDKYINLTPGDFTYEKYRYDFDSFMNEYPVILSTSYALIPSAEQGFIFDYLVIDEASQTDLLSSLLAMSSAKKIIVVGDTKQLPHIENEGLREKNKELMSIFRVPKYYDYLTNNILTSSLGVFPTAPRVLLKEHYRCHPKIINFCNEKYYNNELIVLTSHDNTSKPLNLIKTVPGNHARKNPNGTGLYNQREIDEIKELMKTIHEPSIGVVTPFCVQADMLRRALIEDYPNVDADTVHKFQGRARDVIILSTVANDIQSDKLQDGKHNFITRADLLNVAVSRAKHSLHLVVSDGVFNSKDNAISDLIQYMQYHSDDSRIRQGIVQSIYDLLYSDQKTILESFRKKYSKTGYDSENLTLHLLEEIIRENKPNNLKVAMHVPLTNLIDNYDGLTADEKRYLFHPWTHVDFLIYNTLTKRPVLVVEVDGVRYHEQDDKQQYRDQVKDKALRLRNVDVLRLKTNDSNEKARLSSKLFYQH